MASVFTLAKWAAGGAIAGGIAGGVGGEEGTPTTTFTNVARGATLGGIAGFGLRGLFTRTAGRAALGLGKRTPRMMWDVGKGLGKASMKAGGAVLRHPTTAIWAGAAGLGMYGLARTGPGSVNMGSTEAAILAEAGGNPTAGFNWGEGAMARQPDQIVFEDSTAGLAQALHRRRHK